MPFSILIASGLALAAPEAGKPMGQAIARDYPIDALRRGQSAIIMVSVWIDPKGKVYRCDGSVVTGQALFVQHACRIAKGLTVAPARDANGTPAYGHVSASIKYFLPNTEEGRRIFASPDPVDFSLTVNQLPLEFAPKVKFSVTAMANAEGAVERCEGNADAPAPLAEAACDYVTNMGMEPGTNEEGEPVPYVESFDVELAVDDTE